MNKVRGLRSKDLLGLKELTVEEIKLILDTTRSMKEVMARPIPKVPTLLGKHIVTLFYEPSTRTRTSFNTAAKVLSANVTMSILVRVGSCNCIMGVRKCSRLAPNCRVISR